MLVTALRCTIYEQLLLVSLASYSRYRFDFLVLFAILAIFAIFVIFSFFEFFDFLYYLD